MGSYFWQSQRVTLALTATSTIGVVAWVIAERSQAAPTAPGWDWKQHPRAVVISYVSGKGCSCTPDLQYSVGAARKRNRDVLILASQSAQKEIILGRFATDSRVILSDKYSDWNRFLNPTKTTSCLVDNGKVVRYGVGTIAPGLLEDEGK
jgi:hypothetical protein